MSAGAREVQKGVSEPPNLEILSLEILKSGPSRSSMHDSPGPDKVFQ